MSEGIFVRRSFRQGSGGLFRQVTCFELSLGAGGEPKSIRPKLRQECLLGLSRRGDEDGIHPKGRQVELRAVPAPAHHGLGTLQRRSEFRVGGVAPSGDVAVDADASAWLTCDDQAGLGLVPHPRTEGLFHELPVRFDAADHADFAPGAFRLRVAVLGQAAQDANAVGAGMD